MAFNQIPVPSTQPWGAIVLQLRNQYLAYRQTRENVRLAGNAVLAKLAAMVDGSDYTRLEAQLALSAGQGTILYAELNSVVGNFSDTAKTTAQVTASVDQFNGYIG